MGAQPASQGSEDIEENRQDQGQDSEPSHDATQDGSRIRVCRGTIGLVTRAETAFAGRTGATLSARPEIQTRTVKATLGFLRPNRSRKQLFGSRQLLTNVARRLEFVATGRKIING